MRWLLILTLVGCSSAGKLRRAEKLIAKAESLGAVWHVDSVQVRVPVIVPEIHWDSVVVSRPGDTVTVVKDRTVVKFVRLGGDTVFMDIRVPADTVYTTVTRTVHKTIEAKNKIKWWMVALGFAAGLFTWMAIIQFNKSKNGRVPGP